jgi:hypothetical protein
MSRLIQSISTFRRHALVAVVFISFAPLLIAAPLAPDDRPKESRKGAVVGTVRLGVLLHRPQENGPWQALKPKEPVVSGDLIVGLPAGALDAKNGAVRLSLLSDLARVAPYPVLESAVVLHESTDADLDFTLDRGRVDVSNVQKEKRPAQVRVRFAHQSWDLTLEAPKTRVALLLYGRWPRGVPFTKEPRAGDEPTADLLLMVLEGEVSLRTVQDRFALHAPPGPALFHWNSVTGADPGPEQLKELPSWARPSVALEPRANDIAGFLKILQQGLGEQVSVEQVLRAGLASDNANAREVAVFGLGALDDLPTLIDALGDPKHRDTRDAAVVALRHWIGRKPGQDARLYEALVKDRMFSAGQAETVLQLLHSFGDAALGQPSTYATLIEYLTHETPAIRELAAWHLYRLVPAGKAITYDAGAAPEERKRSQERWHELIPEGKLPPRPPARGK